MNQVNGRVVAVVDDHPMMRNCICDIIARWGYVPILQAANGQELLCKLNQGVLPDLCILDLNMPVMNGYETMRHLKASWPGIKIIVFSMNVKPGANSTLPLGADAELSKAAPLSELIKTLDRLSQKVIARPLIEQQ